MIRSIAFIILSLFVAGVSAYDGYLLVVNESVITEFEENPVCRYLIQINQGDLSLLLRSKALGTTAALLMMVAVWLRQRQLALPVASAVALFQLGLLLYLTVDWSPRTRDVKHPRIRTAATASQPPATTGLY